MLIFVFGSLFAVAVWFFFNHERAGPFTRYAQQTSYEPPPPRRLLPSSWGDRGRRIDPRFVEVLFLERAVLLVTRLLEAAPHRDVLASLSPYVVDSVAAGLARRHGKKADDVVGVVVGHAAIAGIDRTGTTMFIDVELHLNRHLRSADGTPRSVWSHERWSFVKETGADAVDRDDDVIDRFGCPRCGSPLEEDTRGRCPSCQTTLSAGACDWAVRQVVVHDEQSMGPVLTQDVHEVGTDDATVTDEAPLDDARRRLGDGGREALVAHARALFTNLQASWSAQDLDGIRPFETDALFQSHRCWIEEYKRQGLRNVVGELRIAGVQVCRVLRDGDYVVAVLRIGASCTDVTLRGDRVVAGHPQRRRHFTEYWTFVKHKDARGGASLTTCPGCGAPLSITQAGICTSCHRKITLGRFDWVVSRIEQDEEVARTAVA